MKCFFLKSVRKGSANKLVPLKGQILFSDPVDTSFNVAGSRAMREAYPIGTVFGTSCLSFCGTHYAAGPIFPLVDVSDLKSIGDKAPVEMWDEYNTFLASGHTVETDFDSSSAEELLGVSSLFVREMGLFDEEAVAAAAAEAPSAAKAPKTPKAPKVSAPKVPAATLLEEIKRDFATPSIDDCGFYVEEKNWRLLIRNIRRKVNTMLTGPTGTGKTELIRMIGEKLGLEVSVFDMGSMFDPTVQMLGSHRLAAGSSVFDYAPFAKAVQKPGIILLDELSRAPISTNNLLFPCLDSRRSLPVEQAGATEETKIAVHPDCVFIATANIGSQYTVTQELDAALKNRFFTLELDYMPNSAEVDVLMNRTGIAEKDSKVIVKVAGTIRDLFRKGELSTSISTRETLCVAQLVADGFSVIDALEMTVLPQFVGTATEGERSVVRSCFMAA